jgi:hypothetical protein
MKTAADVKSERIRLQGLVIEKENELKGEVKQVKERFDPIPGIASLFNGNKQIKPTRAVLGTGINFLIGKVIAKRVGFLPTFAVPFISKTISEQVMKINLQPYLIEALDWVIEKTDDHEVKTEPSVVFKADAAFPSKTVIAQPVAIPTKHVDVIS